MLMMDMRTLQWLAPSFGTCLVSFLAFSSQWLFYNIEPGPLRKGDAYLFNGLVMSLLVCHWRTCFVDPGRIPKDWQEKVKRTGTDESQDGQNSQPRRWCRKCQDFKPPRAHHCKTCKRCIVKMDHHCVWTANCVSHLTFPHFIRFLTYGVVTMIYLECFLYKRCAVLWRKRNLPSYLGPSVFELVHLFALVVINSFMLFAISLLLGRSLWSMALNTYTIEGWEIERHETLLRRARTLGGYLDGPDGGKVRVERQEYPWDIGIWANLCQAMGTRNVLAWPWPFARSPTIESGLSFEHNGIEDPRKPWPPPDPDRLFRVPKRPLSGNGFTQSMDKEDFRRRQAADFERYADIDGDYVVRRRPFHERLGEINKASRNDAYYNDEVAIETEDEESSGSENDEAAARKIVDARDDAGEEGWRNKEGERLADFGVDEVADFYDEDDVPLAELIRRKKEP